MLIVQGKLIHESVIKEQFICNLDACKGACCWEGDYGAPLETAELYTLENIYEEVKPFLAKEGLAAIKTEGLFTYYKKPKEYGTSLVNNSACVFMVYDEQGVAQCGIEQAYNAGVIAWKKPISCHLYPIRISKDDKTGFETLYYDEWDICSAACALGRQHKMPVYRFVKDALVRHYGLDFYEELDAAAEYMVGK
jgi:hypothetical protein